MGTNATQKEPGCTSKQRSMASVAKLARGEGAPSTSACLNLRLTILDDVGEVVPDLRTENSKRLERVSLDGSDNVRQ